MLVHRLEMSSKSFYVILPSNTKSQPPNKPNHFRVQLPQKLQFNSRWEVGLASLIYPHTWATIGTTSNQWMDLYLTNGQRIRAPVPRGSHLSPQLLEKALQEGTLKEMSMKLGYPSGLPRRKRAAARQPTNSALLDIARRTLVAEWQEQAVDPEHDVPVNPWRRVVTKTDANGNKRREETGRPRLPPGYDYILKKELADGKPRKYVDIESLQDKEMLKAAQAIIDMERERKDSRRGFPLSTESYAQLVEDGEAKKNSSKGRGQRCRLGTGIS